MIWYVKGRATTIKYKKTWTFKSGVLVQLVMLKIFIGFPGRSVVKNPLANPRDEVQFPAQIDPLENKMTTLLILAWEIPWTEEPGG